MAKRVESPAMVAFAAPTEVAVRAATPAETTVKPPNALGFFEKYQQRVAPLQAYRVVDNATYVVAGQAYAAVRDYIDEVTAAFKGPKSDSHKAWKGICALEGMFVDPAAGVADSLSIQLLAWKRKLDDERVAEERRLQEIERQRLQREADERAEQEREARRLAEIDAAAEVMPWDEPVEPVAVELPPVVTISIDVPMVRLPSTVPYIAGGPSTRKKPWAGRCVDFRLALIEAAKRAEAGDVSMLQLFAVAEVRLNQLAREHQSALSEVFPGFEAFQEETLARA